MAKSKLTLAHEKFSGEMLKRLRQKQRQGFAGWDSPVFNGWNIPRRLHDKALKVLEQGKDCDPKDLVDIANFAMFLHHKISG